MTGIDELIDVIEEAVRDAEGGSYYPTVDFRRAARDSLTAIQSVLRERGLLLGPDGLIKAERERDAALADVAKLREALEAIHTPTDQEVEVYADGPGEDYHDEFLCTDDPAACRGHLKIIQVCQECGYDHDDGNPVLREWPCPTLRVLADTAPTPETQGINYDGPDPSVECAYPPCTNRLRQVMSGGAPQWCSKDHRSRSEGSR